MISWRIRGFLTQWRAIPAAERPDYLKEYRKTMITLITRTLELEKALIEGDAAKAKELFRAVRAMEETGHDRFQGDEE